MIKLILPVALTVIGVAGGVGGGYAMRPDPSETVEINPCGDTEAQTGFAGASEKEDGAAEQAAAEYVKLNNQFVVPVVKAERIDALVVLALSIEVTAGQSGLVYESEPKLRDAFLQVLFDHANMGGFAGAFTNSGNMDVLRMSLTEVAQSILGADAKGILITDIGRQDI
ncbi:hypothetical protein RAZWK3B_02575 [Roseobacter sp. AzwK-3b]|uniref:flagellar basal body-associated FliL family protein n=1 Tax=Roseobacter sp. AzwK-3b TaxID=351016 RepID=UPI000156992F|nr:flagellar basal body-associated FliL family protein [Roseobacter sp. AzwK-3b]EDM73069.1 hypothetical protein RAZWK3B_02575 [Roseobacter sp. AzwK-3b]